MHISRNFSRHNFQSSFPYSRSFISPVIHHDFTSLCVTVSLLFFFTLTGPPKWNLSLAYSKFLNTVKTLNVPQIKAETASLTPPVSQGILIAPKES